MKQKNREKSFSSKEALIKWINFKTIEIIDIFTANKKLVILYKDITKWQ